MDFERDILAPGSPHAKTYDRQALLQQMIQSQEPDPAKAWAVVAAPQAKRRGRLSIVKKPNMRCT